MADRAFIEKFESEMRKFAAEIDILKKKVSEEGESVTRLGDIVADLQEQYTMLNYQFKEFKKAREGAAEEIQLGVQKSLEELTMNLNTALRKFKS